MKFAIIACGLLCALPVAHAAPYIRVGSFADVSQESPYFDAVEFAHERGIVEGYDDGTFRPNQTINRAEFVKILIGMSAADLEIDSCMNGAPDDLYYSRPFLFADTPVGAWYLPFVCTAKSRGIVGGYWDGSFRAGNDINVAEAAKIIVQSVGSGALRTGSGPWYAPYISTLEARAALPTELKRVSDPLTRGQMTEIIYRLTKPVTDKPSTTLKAISE